MIDWFTDWVSKSSEWLSEWLSNDWVSEWVSDWLTEWAMTDWFTDWLSQMSYRVTEWLTHSSMTSCSPVHLSFTSSFLYSPSSPSLHNYYSLFCQLHLLKTFQELIICFPSGLGSFLHFNLCVRWRKKSTFISQRNTQTMLTKCLQLPVSSAYNHNEQKKQSSCTQPLN